MSKIDRVCGLLDEHYGRKTWSRRGRVLDELVLTILSQNTTAKNSNAAFRTLLERFPTWDDVCAASCEEIAEAIGVGGLANRKAPRIQAILLSIRDRYQSLDLDWIADLTDAEALDYLTRYDGVGRKTAACVLMFALGRPTLPVDTHVHRVSVRLGLVPWSSTEAAHDLLRAIVPAGNVYSFHINTVTHGREVCHARGPDCAGCVLREECDCFGC